MSRFASDLNPAILPSLGGELIAPVVWEAVVLDYPRLKVALQKRLVDLGDPAHVNEISDYLTDEWITDYHRVCGPAGIVKLTLQRFSYLFDQRFERLVSAWGISLGATGQIRDKSRMRGYPLGGDASYHRGHAIPNQMGGGADINLVAQKGKINIGPFRELERRAVANPGSVYFSYWVYRHGDAQTPTRVQQGLIVASSQVLQLADFGN
jgi:hypothetical protein